MPGFEDELGEAVKLDGPREYDSPTVAVAEYSLRLLLDELRHLRKQRDELQETGTRLKVETQDLKIALRRVKRGVDEGDLSYAKDVIRRALNPGAAEGE